MTQFEPNPEKRREYQGVDRDGLVDLMATNPHLPRPWRKNEFIKLFKKLSILKKNLLRYLFLAI